MNTDISKENFLQMNMPQHCLPDDTSLLFTLKIQFSGD